MAAGFSDEGRRGSQEGHAVGVGRPEQASLRSGEPHSAGDVLHTFTRMTTDDPGCRLLRREELTAARVSFARCNVSNATRKRATRRSTHERRKGARSASATAPGLTAATRAAGMEPGGRQSLTPWSTTAPNSLRVGSGAWPATPRGSPDARPGAERGSPRRGTPRSAICDRKPEASAPAHDRCAIARRRRHTRYVPGQLELRSRDETGPRPTFRYGRVLSVTGR
jgi:hypothetical protein